MHVYVDHQLTFLFD